MEEADSTVSEIALNPTHIPENRDSAIPYRPYSRYSATDAGFRLGMTNVMKATSDWCGIDDETQPWSSPATTSTPPCGELPYALPCFNASPARSTPGPLPYQIPNTPSTVRSGSVSTCCDPSIAVAASSSFTAGRNLMLFSSRKDCARQSSWSNAPSGEPR